MNWLRLLKALFLISIVGALLTQLKPYCFALELNANLSFYYLIILLIFLDLWISMRIIKKSFCSGWIALLALLLLLHFGSQLWPFYFSHSKSAAEAPKSSFRFMTLNLDQTDPDCLQNRELIQSKNPDLVGLLNLSTACKQALKLEELYPHYQGLPADSFGIGLYSKFPLNQARFDLGQPALPPILQVFAQISGRSVQIFLIHLKKFLSDRDLVSNKLTLRRVASLIRASQDDLIVAGDFNFTLYSKLYANFLNWTDLHDAAWGRGLFWDKRAAFNFLALPIDHVLHTQLLEVQHFEILKAAGSGRATLTQFVLGVSPVAITLPADRDSTL